MPCLELIMDLLHAAVNNHFVLRFIHSFALKVVEGVGMIEDELANSGYA